MKKFLSMLLILCLLLSLGTSLVSCNQKDNASDGESSSEEKNNAPEGGPSNDENSDILAKEDWEVMIQDANFENVTFGISAKFLEGLEVENGSYNDAIKIAGDKVQAEGDVMTNPDEVREVKNFYISCVTGLAKNFENFEYDKESSLYVAKEAVSFPVSMAGYTATITATDLKIELNTTNQIAKATFIMRQDIEGYGATMTFIMDTVFTFSDYGTTVIK